MKAETYVAARTISPELHSYFACHRKKARERAEQLAPLPDAGTIETMIEAMLAEAGGVHRPSPEPFVQVAFEELREPSVFRLPGCRG